MAASGALGLNNFYKEEGVCGQWGWGGGVEDVVFHLIGSRRLRTASVLNLKWNGRARSITAFSAYVPTNAYGQATESPAFFNFAAFPRVTSERTRFHSNNPHFTVVHPPPPPPLSLSLPNSADTIKSLPLALICSSDVLDLSIILTKVHTKGDVEFCCTVSLFLTSPNPNVSLLLFTHCFFPPTTTTTTSTTTKTTKTTKTKKRKYKSNTRKN